MKYRCVTDLAKLQDYLSGARLVAFDFETAPREECRRDEKAALDAHKADIGGCLSGNGCIYSVKAKKERMPTPDKVMQWLIEGICRKL